MERKLILFDMDGTLIDCIHGQKEMTSLTKEALIALKQAGHLIMIASGRPYCYLPKEFRDFPFDGYILNDGAYILFSDKEFACHPLLEHQLKPLMQQIHENHLTFIGYGKKQAYVYCDNGDLTQYAQNFLLDVSFVQKIEHLEDLPENIYKFHVHFHHQNDYHIFELNQDDFYCANDENFLLKEIYSTQYTKATALSEILEALNIAKKDSYFFGDGLNDIEMMEAVGHGIAMANASDIVKRHADDLCGHVLEDGVAHFIMNSGLFFD